MKRPAPTRPEDVRQLFNAMAVAGADCCAQWAHGDMNAVFVAMSTLAASARAWVRASSPPRRPRRKP